MQASKNYEVAQIKRFEELKDQANTAPERKQFDDYISNLKTQMETAVPAEQELQVKEPELEQELRSEQAKLDRLQEELDRLDRALKDAALQTSTRQH